MGEVLLIAFVFYSVIYSVTGGLIFAGLCFITWHSWSKPTKAGSFNEKAFNYASVACIAGIIGLMIGLAYDIFPTSFDDGIDQITEYTPARIALVQHYFIFFIVTVAYFLFSSLALKLKGRLMASKAFFKWGLCLLFVVAAPFVAASFFNIRSEYDLLCVRGALHPRIIKQTIQGIIPPEVGQIHLLPSPGDCGKSLGI